MLPIEKESMSWPQAQTQEKENPMQLSGTAKFSLTARLATLSMASLCAAAVHAQVTITVADLFTKSNLYYRVYANRYDPSDVSGSSAYSVPSGLIGGAGPGQFWDFSKGPTNVVLRFDYLSADAVPEAADFPDAKLVEQEKVEEDGAKPQLLFFDAVAGVGRTVYGF